MTKETTAPDWIYWGNLAEVPVWQAIALSLNVAPESLDAAPGGFDPNHCGNLPKEFNPRLRIVSSQLASLGIVRTAWDRYTPDYMLTVSLDCFGIWADSLPYSWNLPDAFPPLESEAVADDAVIDPPRNGVTRRAQLPTMQGLTKAEMLANDWPVPPGLNLPRLLSDVPKWLEPARLARGAPGKNSSALWSPSMFAVCLFSEKAVSKSALSRYISQYMSEWVDDWKTLSEGL